MDIAAAPDPAVQSETDAAIAAAMAATIDEAGPIDENLFDDEDLEMLDEDLEKLELWPHAPIDFPVNLGH